MLKNKLKRVYEKCKKLEIEYFHINGIKNISKYLDTLEFCLDDIEKFEKGVKE